MNSNWAKSYIDFAAKFKYLILIIALLVAAASLMYTKDHLKLNNDLSALLPEDAPTVLGLKESNERFGATDKFMIAIQAKDPMIVAKLQDLSLIHI